MKPDTALRKHLVDLLGGENAHASFDSAVDGVPAAIRGVRAEGSPHSLWETLEHLRIAQWDILEFSRDPKHVSPEFPSGYWPKTPAPPGDADWNRSVKAFQHDLREMIALIGDESNDLFSPIPHGTGQTLLREALLVADHNAYHVGQFMLLRRLLERA